MMQPPPYSAADAGGPRLLLKRLRQIMATTVAPQARLDDLAHAIASNMTADVCSIYLRRRTDILELFATEGLNPDAVHETRLRVGEGLVGVIASTAEPLNLADAPLHPQFAYRPETGEDQLHSFLGVPMLRSGQVLGVLVVQNRAVRQYLEEEVEALQTVAMVLAEVAASGDLVDEEDYEEVDEVLHRAKHIRGAAIVSGIGVGVAAFHEPPVRVGKVIADDVRYEITRLSAAMESLQRSVDDMLASVDQPLQGVPREVLEAYRLFAHDQGWFRRLREAVLGGLTAEAAVQRVQAENRNRILRARDPYLRERSHDLDDLAHRLLRHLTGDIDEPSDDLPDAAILFARTMGPAELLEYDRDKLFGVVLGEGSAASHVAIVARALGIPLVGKAGDALDQTEPGDHVIIDGDAGEIHVRPTSEVVASYDAKIELLSEQRAELTALAKEPARTRDGVDISLRMNAGLQVDLRHLEDTGADGIGLFRTELQFMVSATLPRLGAQTALYAEVLDASGGKPVVFRTVDLGGDKVLPYMEREREENPALGWRAIRMSLDRPGLLRTQFRALLAAAEGRDLDVLLPMVTVAEEVRQAKALLNKEAARREKLGHGLPAAMRLGAMIEAPAAAWRIEDIAAEADFLSVGGNDLMQFFFAAGRDSARVQGRYDFLSPPFLSYLKDIAARAAAAGRPLSFCGEQAGAPLNALGLIGVGFRTLSVSPLAIGPVKRLIRSIDLSAFETFLNARLDANEASIRHDIEAFARDAGVSF
ncbi:MAG: phosphoenolpyruvate--protein phosphotransferase [Pseudomonadota bacterium]